MNTVLRRIAIMLGIISPPEHGWPGMDVDLPDRRVFHLVGSIHMGTRAMAPLPASLLRRLRQATALVVEADVTAGTPIAQEEPVTVPLSERLTPDMHQILRDLCGQYSLDEAALAPLPAWHIALVLQARQAEALGLWATYGIDYQLIQAARAMNKPIIELEGPQQQMDLLLQLPDQGLALLQDTLRHWHANAKLLQIMIGWWLNNRPVNMVKAFPTTFSGDLYQYLMAERNQRWKTLLQNLPTGDYMVAVGALHLYGEHSLPSLLRQR